MVGVFWLAIIVGFIMWGVTKSGTVGFFVGLFTFLIGWGVNYLSKYSKRDRPPRTHSTTDTPTATPSPETTKRETPVSPTQPIIFTPINDATGSDGDIAGVRDALTGEILSSIKRLFQCTNCTACYQQSSVELIKAENDGRCVGCLSSSHIVKLTEYNTPSFKSNYRPEIVTLINYRNHIGHAVTFEGRVLSVKKSRKGNNFALMFENKSWSEGFKIVVFARNVSELGGEYFLHSLRGKTLRVRGLLQKHGLYGPQVIVTNRQMIQDIR